MLTEKELNEKYFYRNELIILCKKFKISHSGTKLELQNRLLYYVRTGKISAPQQKYKKINTKFTKEITLETEFIKNGLKFDWELRNFIEKYTGIEKISFTKYMGHAVRQARKNNTDITVKELIEIFTTPKSKQKELPEEKTYQWNRFVKEFTQSFESNNYTNKLKVASILWEKVRTSSGEKVYSIELKNQYSNLIVNYLKEGYK